MPRALIVGAGIAGLSSAIALRRVGWDVEIVDRAPALEPVGAALGLWSNAMQALRLLGVADRVEREAAPIRRIRLATREGNTLVDLAITDAHLPTRALLQAALKQALFDTPLRLGHEAVHLDCDRAQVGFADGTIRQADLVVVADGIHSPLAPAITGTTARYAGYTGIVALSDPVGIDGHDSIAAEYWGSHERFGLFDLGAGRRYWFWMQTGAEGAPLADMVERAAAFPPALSRAIRATSAQRHHRWPIYAKPPPRRLSVGRALCVGDAAHAMEPNLGQGAAQGIEDALALSLAARDADPAAVPKAFEVLRLARARQLVRSSAQAGLAVHGPAPVQAIMRTGLRLAPSFVTAHAMTRFHRLPGYGQSSD